MKKIKKNENEIIIYPKNIKKYAGSVGPDKKAYNLRFNIQGYKYSKNFPTKEGPPTDCPM